jgi:hypothetical protein
MLQLGSPKRYGESAPDHRDSITLRHTPGTPSDRMAVCQISPILPTHLTLNV